MAINEITGDKLVSKQGNKAAFDAGYDRIFHSKSEQKRIASQLELDLNECCVSAARKCDCETWSLGCCGADDKTICAE